MCTVHAGSDHATKNGQAGSQPPESRAKCPADSDGIRHQLARRLPSRRPPSYGFRYRQTETGQAALGGAWHQFGARGGPQPKALKVAGRAKDGRSRPLSVGCHGEAADILGRTVNDVLDDFIDALRPTNLAERCRRLSDASMSMSGREARRDKRSAEPAAASDSVDLLDSNRGPWFARLQADRTLAYLSKALNGTSHAKPSSIADRQGMAGTKPKERARTPKLDILKRRPLAALDALGNDAPKCVPAFVRASLLTAPAHRWSPTCRGPKSRVSEWTVPPQRNEAGLITIVR